MAKKPAPKSMPVAPKLTRPSVNRAARHAQKMAKKARRLDAGRILPRGHTRKIRRANEGLEQQYRQRIAE